MRPRNTANRTKDKQILTSGQLVKQDIILHRDTHRLLNLGDIMNRFTEYECITKGWSQETSQTVDESRFTGTTKRKEEEGGEDVSDEKQCLTDQAISQ